MQLTCVFAVAWLITSRSAINGPDNDHRSTDQPALRELNERIAEREA